MCVLQNAQIMSKSRRPLSSDEIKQLLEHINAERDRVLVSFMIRTGVCVSEALSLRVVDLFDGKEVRPRVTVTSARKTCSRTIDLDDKIKAALLPLCKDQPADQLFFPITRQWLWKVIKKGAIKAGLKDIDRIGCHSTRYL